MTQLFLRMTGSISISFSSNFSKLKVNIKNKTKEDFFKNNYQMYSTANYLILTE
jgi:hypothetical protein